MEIIAYACLCLFGFWLALSLVSIKRELADISLYLVADYKLNKTPQNKPSLKLVPNRK